MISAMTNQAAVRRGRGGRVVAALLGVVAVTAVAWACGASGENRAGVAASNGKASNSVSGAGANAQPANGAAATVQTPVDTVETTLSAAGFTPNQVSHTAGRFELKVKNESGEGVITLRLADAAGNKLSEAKLTGKVKEWSLPLDIAAGTYTLSEASHSSWTCSVVVTAQ